MTSGIIPYDSVTSFIYLRLILKPFLLYTPLVQLWNNLGKDFALRALGDAGAAARCFRSRSYQQARAGRDGRRGVR